MPNKQGPGKIDYLHFTWSPVKGRCGFAQSGKPCRYCWMEDFWRRFARRKDGSILMDQKIRLDEKELNWTPSGSGKRIGVCFSTDLFHPLVPDAFVNKVLNRIHNDPENDYLFLTKASEHLGKFDFPQNSWVGVSVDGSIDTQASAIILAALQTNAKYKWISLEPYLKPPSLLMTPPHDVIADHIDWVVIGPDSRKGAKPPPDWCVKLIVEWSRKHKIAVWMKDSLVYSGPQLKELPGGEYRRES